MLKISVLGAIQGLTEFFPVSSSGHLVIAQTSLGLTRDILFLDTFLHIGTLFALLTFFFKDILRAFRTPKILACIAIATAATGLIGIIFKKGLESLFASAHDTAWQLLVNGLILLLIPLFKERGKKPGVSSSIVMGTAQGISIIPGISRSGLTIASLLAMGINKDEAFQFSFIASIPAIFGAFLLEAKDVHFSSSYSPLALAGGLLSSYAFGLLALYILKKVVHRQKLHYFGYYCIALSLALLFYFKI